MTVLRGQVTLPRWATPALLVLEWQWPRVSDVAICHDRHVRRAARRRGQRRGWLPRIRRDA